ncbi:PepSY-associated TM helix domain-containing protein [Sphingomonas sp. CJ99]
MTKGQWRNLWLQFHKWIGLALAVAIIPISITGAALVWHDGLERWLHPDRYSVTGLATLPAAAYAQAAAARLAPGEQIARIVLPSESGEPVEVSAARPGPAKGRPVRTLVFMDPADARVIEVSASNAGAIRFMHVLHGSLFIPEVGRPIVGWIGVAMLVSALTGIWLWWPTVGGFLRGLRWRRHPKNTDYNLHNLLGFWIAVPLAVLSLTGVWISFPGVFSQFEAKPAEPRPARPAGPDRAALMRAKPLPAPATPLDRALAAAQSAAPGTVRSVQWPTDVQPEWSVQTAPAQGRPVTIKIADATGEAKPETAPAGGRDQPVTTARLMRQIHDGSGMPFWWQVIVFLGGVLPAILSVTGIIMWARARKWRKQLAQRQRARLAPAE